MMDDTLYLEESPYNHIFVIGAGAWGTALANTAARAGRKVTLWAFEKEVKDVVDASRENKVYLPGIPVHDSVTVVNDYDGLAQADLVLLVTPAQHLSKTLSSLPDVPAEVPFVLCSKGIELESGKILSQLLQAHNPERQYAVLSGPSFAGETAKGMPTAVTVASANKDIARDVANAMSHKTFRPYITDDPIGAQICGAVKNVIAIACGIIHGKNMGDNARAALVTRGLQEIWRLGNAMGAKRKTFMGMSGLGDLMLTCSSMQSRNFSMGVMLGQGRTLDDILQTRSSVTEGVYTAEAVLTLARKHAVEMPICRAVQAILSGEASVEEAIDSVLTRPLTDEN